MKFECINESCPKKGEVIEYHTYGVTVKESQTRYTKNGRILVCSECNTPLSNIPEPIVGGFTRNISLFASKSNEEKKRILKKRAQDHLKHSVEDREYRDAVDKGEIN